MAFLKVILLGLIAAISAEIVPYNAYEGRQATIQELRDYEKLNVTFWCLTNFELPCDPNDYRRVDGTCNNLHTPVKGSGRTPFRRFVSADYEGEQFLLRKSVTGEDLPNPRKLRTQFLSEGRTPSQQFTHLLTNSLVLSAADSSDIHDTINYSVWKPYCCAAQGALDNMCAPVLIQPDDPVHRFSGISCMNLTRPITYQTQQCTTNSSVPARITTNTVHLDLSVIYSANNELLETKGRLFEGGLLKTEIDNLGRIWPPRMINTTVCFLNRPGETRCHDGPSNGMNGLFGVQITSLWFYRNHNFIANELALLNPHWNDEKLFQEARNINIAYLQQIMYYDLFPTFYGRENLINSGLISSKPGFRDLYDETLIPEQTIEYITVLRWVHTIQEGTMFLFDNKGAVYDSVQIVDLTLRTGYLDKNIEGVTQGVFRQGCAGGDHEVDPDISERALSLLHRSFDLPAMDVMKNRHFGFAPYIKYLEKCNGKAYTTWESLSEFIDAERIELLRLNYKSIEDIDLLAGIWLENLLEGAFAPPTLFCIVGDQLKRNIATDRFWYERPNRPHAFNAAQLSAIRNASWARLMCDVADGITEVTRNPLVRVSSENPIVNCDEIPAVSYAAWKDSTCYA